MEKAIKLVDIRSLSLAQLKDALVEMGEQGFRAKQIYEWLWVKSCTDFDEMSNLSKSLRENLIPFCNQCGESASVANFQR